MTEPRQRGRKPKADKSHVIELLQKGLQPDIVAQTVGLSKSRIRTIRAESGLGPGRDAPRKYSDPAVLFGRYVPPTVPPPGFMEPQPGFCAECIVRPATESEVAEFRIKESARLGTDFVDRHRGQPGRNGAEHQKK